MTTKKRLKLFFILFIPLLIIAILLFTDIYTVFLGPLDVGESIDKNYGDCIIVFGGGLKSGYLIGYSTEERLLQAIRLYHLKKRLIIISDGSLYRGSPAVKKVGDFLLREGVAKDHIKYEGKSQTTYDNCVYTRKLQVENKCKQIIICTSPYHQLRAQLILEYLGVKNFKIAPMENSEVYQSSNIGQRLRNIKLILREYFAIIKFKLLKK